MSGKKRTKIISIDFEFGVSGIIPSTQQAYHGNNCDIKKKKKEGEGISMLSFSISEILTIKAKELEQFPSDNEIFVLIVQYFVSKKEYNSRDVDNMAKTMLDLLKEKFYYNDSQVRTLLVHKRIDKKVPQNFAYVAIKEIKNDSDSTVLKCAGIERSMHFYNEEIKKY